MQCGLEVFVVAASAWQAMGRPWQHLQDTVLVSSDEESALEGLAVSSTSGLNSSSSSSRSSSCLVLVVVVVVVLVVVLHAQTIITSALEHFPYECIHAQTIITIIITVLNTIISTICSTVSSNGVTRKSRSLTPPLPCLRSHASLVRSPCC